MAFSITDEVYVFLYSCLSGVLIMLFYDLLSVTEKKSDCSIFLCNVCDGIFMIVALTIMIFINFNVASGIVRGFEFVGAALGAVFYKLTISKLMQQIFKKITEIICSVFKLFFKILLTPLRFMYKMLNKCISALLYPIVRLLRRLILHTLFKLKTSVRTTRKAMKKM